MKKEKFELLKDVGSLKEGSVLSAFGGLVSGVDGIPFHNKEYFKPLYTLLDLQVGDKVLHTGISSFCRPSIQEIVRIKILYCEHTGNPYPVIIIESGQEFDARTGNPKTPPYAYCIKIVEQ